jgi:hypothetical protein
MILAVQQIALRLFFACHFFPVFPFVTKACFPELIDNPIEHYLVTKKPKPC